MVHSRGTRNRPLRVLRPSGYELFCNNINSPGFLQKSLFEMKSPSDSIWVDAISCHEMANTSSTVQIKGKEKVFKCFLVQFWHQEKAAAEALVSVQVHAPSSWTPVIFLDVFERNLQKHEVISLLNCYYIDSEPVHFNTINTMHQAF